MKKSLYIVTAVLLAVFTVTATAPVSHAQESVSDEYSDGIMLLSFVNIYNSSLTFYISDGGTATVMYTVSGKADSGKIIVKTYIERKTLGIFWSRIELSDGKTEWSDSSSGTYMSNTHTVSVRENGTYRATMVIYVDGDSITKTAEYEYKNSNSLGDVDFDGKITAADARMILRYSAGLDRFSSSQKTRADMNGDGKINASDARLALRKAAKLA